MKTTHDVLQANLCAGCGLCVNEPEQMQIDKNGFARPVKPLNDLLTLACPGIKLTQFNQQSYDLSWGPVKTSNVGYSSDENIRATGSSGGVITALLAYCLESKLVDAVIQVGRSETSPIQNEVKIITKKAGLLKNAGSRYGPSSPLSILRKVIGDGRRYAFVGKPCDVAALRGLFEHDDALQEQFPYLFSFMCAGVPSQNGTEAVLEKLGVSYLELADFRYRGEGWPGLTKAITKAGDVKTMTYNEAWGTILNRYLQYRCKICVDGTGESADIVCADAWYQSKNGYPSFEEKAGRSLILSRTQVGESLLTSAIKAGKLDGVETFKLENLPDIQPYQYNRKGTLLARKLALRLFRAPFPKYVGYHLNELSKKMLFKNKTKAFLGTLQRKLKGRL